MMSFAPSYAVVVMSSKNSLEMEKSVLRRFHCQLNEMNFLMQFKLSAVAKNHFCHCRKELSSGCGVSQ